MFIRDMALGNKAEDLVCELLENNNLQWQKNPGKNLDELNQYDIMVIDGAKNTTLEVKFDVMSARTGNIAIEIYNPKSFKDSGLYATKADNWIHIIDNEIWCCPVNTLKQFVSNTQPYRIIQHGGDNNATLLLFRIKDIIPIFERIDSLEEKDFKKALWKYQ